MAGGLLRAGLPLPRDKIGSRGGEEEAQVYARGVRAWRGQGVFVREGIVAGGLLRAGVLRDKIGSRGGEEAAQVYARGVRAWRGQGGLCA